MVPAAVIPDNNIKSVISTPNENEHIPRWYISAADDKVADSVTDDDKATTAESDDEKAVLAIMQSMDTYYRMITELHVSIAKINSRINLLEARVKKMEDKSHDRIGLWQTIVNWWCASE